MAKTIDIKNLGNHKAYTHISISGTPALPGPIKANYPVDLFIHHYDSAGNALSVNNLNLNQCFQSEVLIKNNGKNKIKNLAVIIPYASGWQLDGLEESSSNFYRLPSKEEELNRLIYMVTIPGKSTVHIPLSFTAKFPGNYFLSPIQLINQETNQIWQQSKISYSNVILPEDS